MTVPSAPDSASAARLYEIAAGLAAIGLATRLHRTRTVTDLTATLRPPGHRDIEVILDEDGYTELRYWADLSTTPTAAVATVTGALAALNASRLPDCPRRASSRAVSRLRWRGHRTCGRRWHDGAPRPSGRAGTNPRPSTPAPGGQPSRQPSAPRRPTGPPGTVAPRTTRRPPTETTAPANPRPPTSPSTNSPSPTSPIPRLTRIYL